WVRRENHDASHRSTGVVSRAGPGAAAVRCQEAARAGPRPGPGPPGVQESHTGDFPRGGGRSHEHRRNASLVARSSQEMEAEEGEMNQAFEERARALGEDPSRREALRRVGSVLGAALLASFGLKTAWGACPSGKTPCSGKCVSLQTDDKNCGSCGI